MTDFDKFMLELISKPKYCFDSFKNSGFYAVAFCGSVICPDIYDRMWELEELIEGLIEKHNNIICFVTRESDLGRMVSRIITRLKSKYGEGRLIHILFVPYFNTEIKENIFSYANYYDIIMPYEKEQVPDCHALRDQYMIEESDLVIAHYHDDEPHDALDYASDLNKAIIRI